MSISKTQYHHGSDLVSGLSQPTGYFPKRSLLRDGSEVMLRWLDPGPTRGLDVGLPVKLRRSVTTNQ